MTLTSAQLDRACGVLLGTAAGDALGAAYEFGPPRGPELEVAMVGGGSFGWEPGEWTDDTSMAIAIAEVAAAGADLREEDALDAIVNRWHGRGASHKSEREAVAGASRMVSAWGGLRYFVLANRLIDGCNAVRST
jgi:ADP-ribosylglycohydrolase